MIARIVMFAVAVVGLTGCTTTTARHDRDAGTVAAERDIAAGVIRFCYVGEPYAECSAGGPLSPRPHPPGLPTGVFPSITRHYPAFASPTPDWEYATLYNARMWRYVSFKRHRSSNQAMQPTAGRSEAAS